MIWVDGYSQVSVENGIYVSEDFIQVDEIKFDIEMVWSIAPSGRALGCFMYELGGVEIIGANKFTVTRSTADHTCQFYDAVDSVGDKYLISFGLISRVVIVINLTQDTYIIISGSSLSYREALPSY